jgi:hypothetical protein
MLVHKLTSAEYTVPKGKARALIMCKVGSKFGTTQKDLFS